MIAACPQCQTRYRLAREKIGAQGARIRCSQCQTIFRVQSPEGGAPTPPEAKPSPLASPAPTAAPAPAPKVAPKPAAPAAPPPPPPAPPKPLPPLARALLAELDADHAKTVTELLAQWRIEADVVDDGAEALVHMFRSPPALAILGGDLPSLTGSRIAEIAQRASELAAVKLIRIATASDQTGTPGFDAEEMLEAADYPAGLAEILGRLGIGAKPSAPPTPAAPAPLAKPTPAPTAAPGAARPQTAKPAAPAPLPRTAAPVIPSSDPATAAAERLARIAVSDVILYNQEKFAAAAARGTAAKEMASELGEARQHFNSRVAPSVRADRDFLVEELERRAAVLKNA